MGARTPAAERVEQAIRAVLPAGTTVDLDVLDDGLISVDVGAGCFTARWIGEGWLRDAIAALTGAGMKPEVLVARRVSPGARSAAADARVGWIDESGAAEVALPNEHRATHA